MLVVFPPIFVAETKILTGYNCVALLNMSIRKMRGFLEINKLETSNENDGTFELLNGGYFSASRF